MSQGWVCVHRQLLDNPIFKNDKLFRVFMYCLLKASHTDHDQLVGDCIVKLKKGDLATGRNAISTGTGLTPQNVRTALLKLEKLDILTSKPTNKFSIISITNWDQYQQANKQLTSSQQTTNKQLTTNNKVNNVSNGNKKDLPDVDNRFNQFWDLYNKKEGSAKCKAKWNKLKPSDVEKIFTALPSYVSSTPDKQYRKNPLTWLNGEHWNDDIQNATQNDRVAPRGFSQ